MKQKESLRYLSVASLLLLLAVFVGWHETAASGLVHVSFGGADVCTALGFSPGCDANFSGVANEQFDGRVVGRWQDTLNFGGPGGIVPVHVAVDCLSVSGNQAWISGVVTNQPFAGIPVITKVADNGRSRKDPPDQISFIFVDSFGGCTNQPDLPLFDVFQGQVTVRP